MATKKTDCEAINPQIVEKVSPKMPDTKVLYELSDFFKVMGCIVKYDKICSVSSIEGFEDCKTCKNDKTGEKCLLFP